MEETQFSKEIYLTFFAKLSQGVTVTEEEEEEEEEAEMRRGK